MNKDKGFTLVEVAIVLVIGGILLATASALLLNYMKKVQLSTTERRLETIDEALQLFLSLNGRYPCVADPAAAIDSATFGREPANLADCTTTTALAGGRGGRVIRGGAVPVRTLNLPDDFIGDAWGGRFTYAVTENLVTGVYDKNEGGIFVVDSDTATPHSVITPDGSAHYVIVSHGANNSGAIGLSGGGAATPCTAGNLEEENCNGDATFRSTILLGTADNARLYDDLIVSRAVSALDSQMIPPNAVMAFNLPACPEGWIRFGSAAGRTIVGEGTVGATTYAVGDTGGNEALDGVTVNAAPINPAAVPGAVFVLEADDTGIPIDTINMSPYISLLYCEKT